MGIGRFLKRLVNSQSKAQTVQGRLLVPQEFRKPDSGHGRAWAARAPLLASHMWPPPPLYRLHERRRKRDTGLKEEKDGGSVS